MKKQKPEGQLLDHNYDGIQELDNPLPRWWVYLFYITCIFSVFYVGYYQFGSGLSIQETFAKDMQADQKPTTATANALAVIPEGPEWVAKGKVIFESKCTSCHGPKGEGLIGPNLTDPFWIHGKGKLSDLVAVISKGVPEKGMISWDTQLKPEEIAAAANYVHSLQGSNPANAKPPQGEKAD